MNCKIHNKTLAINQGIEARLKLYIEKLKIDKYRFLRNMLQRQDFLKSEYKRLKDERFRNLSEKALLRHHDIGKVFPLDNVPTDGLLHCPGIQGRFNRLRKTKRSKNSLDTFSTCKDHEIHKTPVMKNPQKDEQQNSKGLKNSFVNFHPIPTTKFGISSEISSSARIPVQNKRSKNYGRIASRPKTSAFLRNESGVRKGFLLKQRTSWNILKRKDDTVCSTSQYKNNPQLEENINDNISQPNQCERRHTAPLLSRLSMIKSQIIEEETKYVLHLRKQSQRRENDQVTEKVWMFIGKRPVSASANYYALNYTPKYNKKRNLQNDLQADSLNKEEDRLMRNKMKKLSRRN